MKISLEMVKKLREKTQAPVVECKFALEKAQGNLEEAEKILRKRGIEVAQKKSGRKAKEGVISSYIHHNGKVGVLVELNCETDFVARNQEFREFGKNIAMHIAAFSPRWISPEDVPPQALEEEKAILREQAEKEGKPPQIVEKIVEGRLKKFYTQKCLLSQPYFKDMEKTVKDVLQELISKVGENIKIGRFVRMELGE